MTTPPPFYPPMRPGARVFWTLATVAAFGFTTAAFIDALAH